METPDITVSLAQKKQSASRPREAPGLLRELLSVEWKLFRRNRRPRWILVFFAVVSLLAMLTVVLMKEFDIIFLSYVVNAMIIYIVCGFGLRGSFYDGLLSRPVSQVMIVRNVVFSIHIIMTLFFVLLALASLVNILQGRYNIFFMITSMFLYILGIINYLVILLSSFDSQRVELNAKSSEMSARSPIVKDELKNWRITGMIVLLPLLAVAVPSLLLTFFPATHGAVFPAIGVLGLAGLLFHAGWVRLITRSLEKRRYELLERFRISRRRV